MSDGNTVGQCTPNYLHLGMAKEYMALQLEIDLWRLEHGPAGSLKLVVLHTVSYVNVFTSGENFLASKCLLRDHTT